MHIKRVILVSLVVFAIAPMIVPASASASPPPKVSDYTSAQLQSMANAPGQASTSVTTVASPTGAATVNAVSETCWNNTQEFYHGTWPQQHNEIVFTHWCMSNSDHTVTSRTTTVNGDVFFCSFDSWGISRLGGGVGYTSVTIQADSYFGCPSGIPYLTLHFHEWAQIKYAWGGYVANLNHS